jgi:hypothetical protein
MFEMQQFKVNMDALRFVVAHGGYARMLAAGVDLVDFASQLHLLVPQWNRLIPYDAGYDWAPSAPVVAAMLEAVDRYTDRQESREALKALIRSRLSGLADEGGAPGDATPRFEAAQRPSPRAPQGAADDRAPPVALSVREGGRAWTLRIEPAAPDRQYFRVVGGCGLSYDSVGSDSADRRAGAVLNLLVQRLLKMTDAGAALDQPAHVADRLERIRIPGLEIAAVTPAPGRRGGTEAATETPAADTPAPPPGSRPRRLHLPMAGDPGSLAPRGS